MLRRFLLTLPSWSMPARYDVLIARRNTVHSRPPRLVKGAVSQCRIFFLFTTGVADTVPTMLCRPSYNLYRTRHAANSWPQAL